MKLRHLLTGTILTISLLAASAVTAFAAVSKGRFETVDSTTISGWAYNSDSPDDALNVMITIKNKNTGEEVFSQRISAGEYREGLYKENRGNGCHGFTINMDWSAYPDGIYLVEGTSPTPGHTPTAMGMPRQEALPAHRDWCPLGSLRLPLTAPAAPVPKAGDAIHVPAPLPRPDTPSQ